MDTECGFARTLLVPPPGEQPPPPPPPPAAHAAGVCVALVEVQNLGHTFPFYLGCDRPPLSLARAWFRVVELPLNEL